LLRAGARIREHAWPIVQTALSAVVAWYLARLIGTERQPTFAVISAVVSLGAAFGERRQRAVQLIAGVMLGIVVADLLVRAIGHGVPQVGVLVALAMLAAVALGGGEMVIGEAAVSAVLVATTSSHSLARLLDVLIGGGVALVAHTLLFPPDPVTAVARSTRSVFDELGSVLRDAAAALAAGDLRHADAARQAAERVDMQVSELKRAIEVGADTARWAPLRRGARRELARYARTVGHAELAARNARVLARNVFSYVRGGRPEEPRLADAVRELGQAAVDVPAQFEEPWRSGDVLRTALGAASLATTAAAQRSDIALNEIAGQVRSIAIDLLRASEAMESDHGALIEAPTEDLIAAVVTPQAA
jgi:uncharacterized membrane protein YgaE (UPF0421/DUF939 family)